MFLSPYNRMMQDDAVPVFHYDRPIVDPVGFESPMKV